MDFLKLYESNVKLNQSEDFHITPNILIPNIYKYPPICSSVEEESFLQVLAGGNIKLQFPISFSFFPLNCYIFIYTKQGESEILCQNTKFYSKRDTIFLFDSKEPLLMKPSSFPWIFKILFISKNENDLFTPILSKNPTLLKLSSFSPIEQQTNRILSSNTILNLREVFQIHESLTIILSNLCYPLLSKEAAKFSHIPDYISEMRDYFDHHYEEPFSLDEYEKLFEISKYRLCREFSNIYGLPPLKYLIQKRMEIAKTMLLSTNWTIHEISIKVGYDNVTHFINLFKKHTGMTPNLFRQKSKEI